MSVISATFVSDPAHGALGLLLAARFWTPSTGGPLIAMLWLTA
ncbi:hypothetical protein [Aliiroseovarius sediminis]|nr:hypothetical protein [Aliiroseovarius sediminis]